MFTCKICGQSFEKRAQLTSHIQYSHKEYNSKTYYDKFLKKEGEGFCKTCGKPTLFKGLFNGYQTYCGIKCAWQDPEVKDRRAKTNSTKTAEEKAEWRKKNIEAHRNENGKCISDEETAKRKAISENSFTKYLNAADCTFIEYITSPKKLVRFKCNKCGNESTYVRSLIDRMARNNDMTICHFCNNHKSVSTPERELRKCIYDMEPGKISLNDRRLLDGKELDIVLPDHKLAIEFDGLYWHNENVVSPDYHLKKTEECAEKGYQLIHIFEDEWINKKDIVISRLRGLLGKNKRIFARNTICKQISFAESKEFLIRNHIQGSCQSKWQYGLFHEGRLVSVMTFGKSRFSDEFELLRFANELNVNVIGGASKLLSHFTSDHTEIENIISYADRRWSNGNLYKTIGFELVHKSAPAYFYIVNHERRSRIEFQKHKLVKEGYDANKTEHEIMKERGYPRIYDAGTLKYIWKRNEAINR